MNKRVIAFITDLHVGSPYGLWPDDFVVPTTQQPIKCSPGQLELWEHWEDFKKKCDDYNVDTVISLGDLIDGNNPREYGRDRTTSDINMQIMGAKQIIEPIKKNRDFFGVKGTDYHSGSIVDAEQELIAQLNGVYWGRLKNIKLRNTNVHFNISHGEGGAFIYRATKADRELLFMKVAEAERKINFHIDLFVRGHLHYFGYLKMNTNAYLACPAWVDWIPYRPALGLYGRQVDIGGVIVIINDDDKITPIEFLYPLPNMAQNPMEV